MRAAGHGYQLLSPAEEETIHAGVLRIVERVGLVVENDALLERLAAIGGRVDCARQRVTFSAADAEAFIAGCERVTWPAPALGVSAKASIYYGHYLNPDTDEFLPMTAERARDYFRVARAMPHIDGCGILGCPLEGIPPAVEPLYERYWDWSLGARSYGSIHRLSLCAPIQEMCQAHAAAIGLSVKEVFSGTVYLKPPLRLAHQEAEQVMWFAERGLHARVGGTMASGGATAPVTLAGMVTLTIAERLLLGLLHQALYGERRWWIGMDVGALDPRTMMRPFGRPDTVFANLIGAQMARRYGAGFSGLSGVCDAPRPSPQAAAQKLQGALPLLLSCGQASIEAGLLGVDMVYSPVQLVLDEQMLSSLDQFTHEYEISEETVAADLVEAVGQDGDFLAEEHTAKWFRRELWEPMIWERKGFPAWQAEDGRTDVQRARERVLTILSEPPPPSALGEDEERALKRIIAQATKTAR
jgi:trimethylamine--corrinoid protein Co-methyltransferase